MLAENGVSTSRLRSHFEIGIAGGLDLSSPLLAAVDSVLASAFYAFGLLVIHGQHTELPGRSRSRAHSHSGGAAAAGAQSRTEARAKSSWTLRAFYVRGLSVINRRSAAPQPRSYRESL